MNEVDAQHQDELLKKEELMRILKNIWYSVDIPNDDVLFLASAVGLSKELVEYARGY